MYSIIIVKMSTRNNPMAVPNIVSSALPSAIWHAARQGQAVNKLIKSQNDE